MDPSLFIVIGLLLGCTEASDFGSDSEAFMIQSFDGSDWDLFDEPPNIELLMPPPPLPPSLRHMIWENLSLSEEEAAKGDCNFCHLFRDPSEDSEFVSPKAPEKTSDSMISVLIASVLGLIFGSLLLVLIWCKKWRIFPAKDSCPIFPDGFLRSHKSVSNPPSTGDPCILPVVNEKSPQSIITDAPSKKTSIPSKYWRKGGDVGLHMNGSRIMHPSSSLDDHYTDGGSCTSSPVYAELDGAVPGSRLSLDPSIVCGPILIAGPSQSISPYAVGLNAYSEVPEALRMGALGPSAALLPDSSYDNAAYLAGHYTRSLRRGQGITLAHLGSAAPLLNSPQTYHIGSPANVSYLTGGRVSKKPRPPFVQQLGRHAVQRMHQEMMNESIERDAQLRYTTRRIQALYSDPPLNSPTLSTFKSASPLGYRENPKRPLPPVPGVRL